MIDMELLTTDLGIGLRPERPEAGAEMEVRVTPGEGLARRDGLIVVLRDGTGEDLAIAPLHTNAEDGAIRAVLRVAAPVALGDHRWSVGLSDGQGTLAEDALTFEVVAPAIRPSIWNLPSAIVAGERFGFTVGFASAPTREAAGWAFVLEDQDGTVLKTGVTDHDPLPGQAGIHGAEIELVAPSRPGRHVWRLRPAEPGGDGPHVPVAVDVHLNVVRPPDRLIRLRAVDAATGAPVARARVVAHPFRALTDAEGQAEIAVPSGSYRVFVSGLQYFPFRAEIDLETEEAVEILAELYVDRPFDETDQWA